MDDEMDSDELELVDSSSNRTATDMITCWMSSSGNYSDKECEDDSGEVSYPSSIIYIYQAWVPVILFFCALTFLFNVFIVIAARWMRRPLTPTMFFSLSLAAADAIASLNVGLGLVLNT